VALAIQCNWRPPDVAPVVLRFNYETHIMHQPTNSTTTQHQRPHIVHPCTKFQRNRTISGWVIDDLANLSSPLFRVPHTDIGLLGKGEQNCIKFAKNMGQSSMFLKSRRFQISLFISKRGGSDVAAIESRGEISHSLPLSPAWKKISRGMGEMSEWKYQVCPRPKAALRSRRLEVRWKKIAEL